MSSQTLTTVTTTENILKNNEKEKLPEQPWNYINIFFIVLGHILFVYIMITFQWIEKFHLVVHTFIIGLFAGFGVTAGAHRYFTHRSYKATKPLKIFLLICYAMSGHNKLYDWVRDHRTHHKYAETHADPHNSNRGFFFSHVGWLFMKKHPEVINKGKTIDMTDISGDPILVWYDRHFILLKTVFCFIIPTILPYYLFNDDLYTCITTQCIARYIILLNITWSVNSVAHIFGNMPYVQSGNAKENLTVSVLALGEGWHNYHHAFPWDYRASEYGKINFTTTCINYFGKIGWAYDFKTTSESLIKRVAEKHGDGSHEKYGNAEEDYF